MTLLQGDLVRKIIGGLVAALAAAVLLSAAPARQPTTAPEAGVAHCMTTAWGADCAKPRLY